MMSTDRAADQNKKPPTIDDVHRARERIAEHVHRTPVVTCTSLDRITGARLFFKCENLQKVGAFKARGASNAVLSLTEDAARRGVATHSSGNHAAALAWAAGRRGVSAHIVMPSNAPPVKRAAVEGYGGSVTECTPTLEARENALAEVVHRTGATFIHPYDNSMVVAGQGTTAIELLEDHPHLDVVIPPVGGGGLASGTTIAVCHHSPHTAIIGAEPAEADDARRSILGGCLLGPGNPNTVADGLRTALSPLTYGILRKGGVTILTASEGSIITAMRLLWERAKLLVEPSAAVPLAVVLEHPDSFQNRRVGIILSGGNADLDRLPWIDQDA